MSKGKKSWVQYDKSIPYIDGREPYEVPNSHLIKVGRNSYKVIKGRRPSKLLLIKKLRKEINKWRNEDYPGISKTTRELLYYWFDSDHILDGKKFKFWFCEREAIETLIYLFEIKKYKDIKQVIHDFSQKERPDILGPAVQIEEDFNGKRTLTRFFPEMQQLGQQELPEENLLRYAFKMATGSGKTYVMALVIVWSYFNRINEKDLRFSDNFLIVAPNVIVYERLAKDFANNEIFNNLPIIPPHLRYLWNIKIILRGDDSPFNKSCNLIINNIQQIYESRSEEWKPENIVDIILGRKPRIDLTKSSYKLLDKIKDLNNLIVMNDEGHHVHDIALKWYESLISIHKSLPDGLTLWLDFSATPKFLKDGTYFPWIIVDYPLAQAIEDRIVKAPLVVHRIDKKDPENINRDNVVQKYGDWIIAALERWRDHYNVYNAVNKKPVLFIMAENNTYADKIYEFIKKNGKKYNLSDDEIMVIHTQRTGDYYKKDLDYLRKLARDIDERDNQIKIIVSVLMLREGWDVQNVTISLGLRPFSSKAEILPEQAIGRGLRLMKELSPDHTQTLEIIGTNAFEEFVRKLETEGVALNIVKKPPRLPIMIIPEKSRSKYDIEIPRTDFRYIRNYVNLSGINPLKFPSLYNSQKLENVKKIKLKMEFPITETEIHVAEIDHIKLLQGRELLIHITNEIMKKARMTCSFNKLYPLIEKYILKKCFGKEIKDIENEKLCKVLTDIVIQEVVIDLIAKELGTLTVEKKETIIKPFPIKLSGIKKFTWRRNHIKLKKTIFNFVATYNNFEEGFANFLDKCGDIDRFASLAGGFFKIDYLSSRGAIRFYYPDFVAVQTYNGKFNYWIIETKGRQFQDAIRKDEAMIKWCFEVSKQVRNKWNYLKVLQKDFDKVKKSVSNFSDLIKKLENLG